MIIDIDTRRAAALDDAMLLRAYRYAIAMSSPLLMIDITLLSALAEILLLLLRYSCRHNTPLPCCRQITAVAADDIFDADAAPLLMSARRATPLPRYFASSAFYAMIPHTSRSRHATKQARLRCFYYWRYAMLPRAFITLPIVVRYTRTRPLP